MVHLYRYVSVGERRSIESTLCIQSWMGTTWFAMAPPSLYLSNNEARTLLSLPDDRQYRFGPVLDLLAPTMDVCPQRTASPQPRLDGSWSAGGGEECATSDVTRITGFAVLEP